MNSLKGLQKAEYTCPECKQTSLVTEFSGTLSKVQCPHCNAMQCSAVQRSAVQCSAVHVLCQTLIHSFMKDHS
jgi:peptide subunit release factor 1 (eRF1)